MIITKEEIMKEIERVASHNCTTSFYDFGMARDVLDSEIYQFADKMGVNVFLDKIKIQLEKSSV